MHRLFRTTGVGWLWRGAAVLAVMLGLVATQAAAYADSTNTTITLYAQQAPPAAYTSVEFQDPSGGWHAVTGWQGPLDTLASGLRWKQWAVDGSMSGQGPFRWVVYTQQGGTVWGTSQSFYLPSGLGVDQSETIEPGSTSTTTAPAAAPMSGSSTTIPTNIGTVAPLTAADSSNFGLACGANCGESMISVYLPDSPAGSLVGVQWQDGLGAWHNVDGWQATVQPDANNFQVVRWTISPASYGQGPFRWVVVQPDGSVWGVSPGFNLPTADGVDYTLFLLRH